MKKGFLWELACSLWEEYSITLWFVVPPILISIILGTPFFATLFIWVIIFMLVAG